MRSLGVLMPLIDFIRAVFLNDLRRMVYDANLHYLAFGTIADGIEFIGACDNAHPLDESDRSLRSRHESYGTARPKVFDV